MICFVVEEKEKMKFLLGLVPTNMIKLQVVHSVAINLGGKYESH